MSQVLKVWKRIFKNPRYVLLALIIAFLFYLLNGFFLNVKNAFTTYLLLGPLGTAKLLFLASVLFHQQVNSLTLIAVIALSLLFGIFISLLTYRVYQVDIKHREKIGVLGTIGVFLGLAAPGCVACGVGVISLIGFSSLLALLPFGGQEIVFLALILVSISVINLSRKLYNPVCKLDFNGKTNERGK